MTECEICEEETLYPVDERYCEDCYDWESELTIWRKILKSLS